MSEIGISKYLEWKLITTLFALNSQTQMHRPISNPLFNNYDVCETGWIVKNPVDSWFYHFKIWASKGLCLGASLETLFVPSKITIPKNKVIK